MNMIVFLLMCILMVLIGGTDALALFIGIYAALRLAGWMFARWYVHATYGVKR